MRAMWWGCLALVGCSADLPWPPELEQRVEVTGTSYCRCQIAGRSATFYEARAHLRLYRPEDVVDTGCEELWVDSLNPDYGSCGHVIRDGGTRWVAELSAPPYPGLTGRDPTFTSLEGGLGIWGLNEGVTFSGLLTYERAERRLRMELDGTGIGSTSTTSGLGSVRCVYEAIIPL